ncbi:hypothetical protein CHS0354_022965 [Potamilus streckersoni]|uniref:Uncharacterized protein n=1 Tax=Potamilus streckersoni TaxID=2493646 RepID=A0AAE0VQR4_9BIVA|nr:hypothetical protein CHS0354_022965 [Potamilus streckersoni]
MGGGMSFPMMQFTKEKVVIVTGSNTGIGYETAKWIAMMGACVIMACRSKEKAQQAIQRMQEEFRMEKSMNTPGITDADSLNLEFMSLDLMSFKSTMAFTEAFKRSGRPLHILVCNAGLGLSPYELSEDGFERMFQVNYLSQFLLIVHLLPIMKTSGEDCRIVLVSSIAHKYASRFDVNSINYKGEPDKFSSSQYYFKSKEHQVMQMFSMNHRLQGSNVTITSLHPGLVKTEFSRYIQEMNCCWNCIGKCLWSGAFTRTPFEGAKTTIDAAVNPKWKGKGGIYFESCKETTPTPQTRNEEYQTVLWRHTLELLKNHLPSDVLSGLEGKNG